MASFIVLVLTFISVIHFEVIFVFGAVEGSTFIFLHVAIQFSQLDACSLNVKKNHKGSR